MLVENTLSLVRVIVASEFVVVTLIALAGTLLVHFCLFYGVFFTFGAKKLSIRHMRYELTV